MHLPWSRKGKHCGGPVDSDADLSLIQADRDVAYQARKQHEEHEVIERLKTIRAHNGLADALYIALTRRGGHQ
jgi:hypothetical protein